MSEIFKQEELVNFFLSTQQHIHENIKFADQKAAQIIGVDGALLALLNTVRSGPKFDLWFYFFCGALAFGIGLSLMVIYPRGGQNRNRGEGVVDSDRIAHFRDEEDYIGHFSSTSKAEVIRQLQILVFDRACIDKRKYFWLRISIFISAVGWVSSFMWVLKTYNG